MFKIGRLVHTNDLSARKTVAAQSWCSRLSRERFSAMALSWLNLPRALKAAIGNGKRTLGHPASLARAGGPRQGPAASAFARRSRRDMLGLGSPAHDPSPT